MDPYSTPTPLILFCNVLVIYLLVILSSICPLISHASTWPFLSSILYPSLLSVLHASTLYLLHLTGHSHTLMSIHPPPQCASIHRSLHPTHTCPSFHLSNQHSPPTHSAILPSVIYLVQPINIHPPINIASFQSPIHSSIQATNTCLPTDPSVHTTNVYPLTYSPFHSHTHPLEP